MKLSIHPNLNFTNGSWMILLIGEIKINLDDLFQKLNKNHTNMKYTVDVKPEIFLDKDSL